MDGKSTKSSQSKLKDVFLSCYDESFHEHVIEFGKRITQYSETYDVLVFMARKCVCLVEAMKSVGLVQLHGISTSHRALDFDLQWLKNRKVAIVDDALISGTTIFNVQKKLSGLNCKIDTYVLCVNENWKKAKLVKPKEPYLEFTDEDCASLCSDIVTSISVIPIPYSTDYPIYSNLQVKGDYFHRMSAGCYWEEVNTSTNIQEKHGVFTKTYEPTIDGRNRLIKEVGTIVESSAILKIRLYARRIAGTSSTLSCTITPIFVFHKLSITQVERVFSSLVRDSGELGRKLDTWCRSSIDYKDSIKSKLRILQYLVSQKLIDFWSKTLNETGGEVLIDNKINQSLRYLFPEPLIPIIIDLTKCSSVDFFNSSFNNHFKLESKGCVDPENLERKTDSWSIQYELMKKFLHLYHKFEVPARQLIWKYGSDILERNSIDGAEKGDLEEYQKYLDRLDRGYSTEELYSSLEHIPITKEVQAKCVSLFLDNMIDIGVVVPITCVEDNCIFRGFRHGEDVNFGDGERHAIYEMLCGYLKAVNGEKYKEDGPKDIIAGIEVEKLSVLTIKRMLDLSLFTRPVETNVLGQNGTIGVRFSLHGAVVAEGCPHVYDAPSDSTIRAILCDQGVLELATNDHSREHGRYKLKKFEVEKTAVRKGVLDEAVIIGAMYGYLRGRSRYQKVSDRLTQKDLTLLATISNTKDLVGALAAELKFVDKVFRRKVVNFRSILENKNPTESFLKGLRDEKRNHLFVALHSAHFKYSSWEQEKLKTILEKVNKGLLLSDETGMRAGIWRKMWPLGFNQRPHKELPFYALIQKLAFLLYQVRFFYTAFELSIRQMLYGELLGNEKAIQEIDDCYKKIINLKPEFKNTDDFILVRELGLKKGRYTENVGMAAVRAIEYSLYAVDDLLLQSDAAATSYGEKEKIFSYRNALLVLINPNHSELDSLREDLLNLLTKEINEYFKRPRVTRHAMNINPSEIFGIKNGFLVAGYRQLELDFLSSVPIKLVQKYGRSNVSFILISSLNENTNLYRFESDTQTFGKGFYERILSVYKELERNNCFDYDAELIVAVEKEAVRKRVFSKPARNELNRAYKHSQGEQLELKSSNGLFPSLDSYKLTLQRCDKMDGWEEIGVGIGIVAIVSDEVRAVKDYVKQYSGYRDSVRVPCIPSRRFDLGSLPAKDGGYHRVVITRAPKQGNEAITSAVSDMVEAYNPSLIVLLGIGGGIDKKLDFCDVVIGDSVLDYDKRSLVEEGECHTYNSLMPIEPWVKDLYQQFEEEYGENPALASTLEPAFKANYSVSMSPIASGNAVVKDKGADVRKWVSSVSRKSQVVETEAVGFVEKYEHLRQRSSNNLNGYLIVRGISDLADKEKDKQHRYEPAYNSMDALSKITSLASPNFEDEVPK